MKIKEPFSAVSHALGTVFVPHLTGTNEIFHLFVLIGSTSHFYYITKFC
ncbi:uncharacterized protein METZ01_LOCUS167875 [marine metagenome]|jgi:predicted membrane channel-forming protein YqfA (hemolysin III family)|uniref:Uncharacterized protein n=1 Tax=marine metagenome TaxID=408172 RepID=A0A382BNA7_9ZZZZ